jgi:hypothetical protein
MEAGDQFERRGPVGARVAGNGGLGVALGAVLHVAGFGRPTAVQAGPIAPFRIEFDAVRRVGHHEDRLALAEETGNILRAGGVSAKHPVFAAKPQVAGAGHRILGNRRHVVGALFVRNCQ